MYKLYSFKICQYVMPFLYFFYSIGLFPPRSVCYKNLTKPQAENNEYEYIQAYLSGVSKLPKQLH
jgi:hypothetical protein